MRRLSSNEPCEGMYLVNPDEPTVKFLPTEDFVMMVFEVEKDKEFITVYLQPYGNGQTLITAHLPELSYISTLRDNKLMLLKLLSRSPNFAKVFQNNSAKKDMKQPFICEIKDFTSPNNFVWCFQRLVDQPLTPMLIDERHPEYQDLENAINDIIHVAIDYLKIFIDQISDPECIPWLPKINQARVEKVLRHCEKEKAWAPFINTIDNISDDTLKDLLCKHKVVLCGDSHFYGLGGTIMEEDFGKPAQVLIMVSVICPSFKDSNLFLYIDLDEYYGKWLPKVNMGEYLRGISIALNHINTEKWAKIDKEAYAIMPNASKIWFYNNSYHDGADIDYFVKNDDRNDYNIEVMVPSVIEPTTLRSNRWGRISQHQPWTDGFVFVAYLVNDAFLLMEEFDTYFPKWKKRQMLDIGTEVLKVVLNPAKYIMKKIWD